MLIFDTPFSFPFGSKERDYEQYNLFCIKTQLVDFFKSKNIKLVVITFLPMANEEIQMMELKLIISEFGESLLNLSNSDHIFEISSQTIKEKLSQIMSTEYKNLCIIYSGDVIQYDNGNIVPQWWINSIIKYLPYDPDMHIDIIDNIIYADLSNVDLYVETYNNFIVTFYDLLKTMYEQGYIVTTNQNFIKDYKLNQFNNSNIYYIGGDSNNGGNLSEYLKEHLITYENNNNTTSYYDID